ncbi:MAG: hypothetical protein DSZ28_03005 [Thiothrix sp.]|nr:MAG: hypothetical protein DSZ28_03005 [Thiothrix sp.]
MFRTRYLSGFLFLFFSSSLFAGDYSLPSGEWRIISLPSKPPVNENTIGQVFGNDINAQYGTHWALYQYDSETNSYDGSLKPEDVVEHGRGYWIIQVTGSPVTLTMPTESAKVPENIQSDTKKIPEDYPLQLASVSGSRATQWTLSGNPFTSQDPRLGDFLLKTHSGVCSATPCSLDEAMDKKLLHNQVWAFNGAGYVRKNMQDTLNSWDGFWVASLEQSQGRVLALQKRSEADIKSVSVTGSDGNYTFAVKIKSDDAGWDQYADGWEVLNAQGDLVYRRVLGHPHVNEQPFTRSGGPVNVGKADKIYIRAHLNNKGYVGDVFGGSVERGFTLAKENSLQSAGSDTTKPTITLLGDQTSHLFAGNNYADEGATANDDIDGDITSNIVTRNNVDTSTPGTYTVTYNVVDVAGNVAIGRVRTVIAQDIGVDCTFNGSQTERPNPERLKRCSDLVEPVIALIGDTTVMVKVGDTYADAGATATDDKDGDITAKIVTLSDVDTTTPGTYTTTYNVTDEVGNTAIGKVRTVVVNSTGE